jgi:single-strand DNA-binding protein
MNQTTIAGHLGADPEVRFTSSGQKVTTLRVAARARRGKDKDETIWWRVSIWGEQFDKMIPYFKKGSPIIVVGDMNKPEIFTDRDGKPQVSMSLTAYHLYFSPFGRPDSGSHAEGRPEGEQPAMASVGEAVQGQGKGSNPFGSFGEDEVPF